MHGKNKDLIFLYSPLKTCHLQDVAARGIDVLAADCIVQYTGPQTDEDYVHRVGRTGRAGQTGLGIIFLTHEEQDYVTRLREHRVL